MISETQAVGLFNVASGVLFTSLGLFVLSVRPRRPANVALGVFALVFGIGWGGVYINNLWVLAGPAEVVRLITLSAAFAAAGIALVALVRVFPASSERGEWLSISLASVLVGVFLASTLITRSAEGAAVGASVLEGIGRSMMAAGFWTAVIILALRYGRTPPGRARRSAATVASALVLWPAMVAGYVLGGTAHWTTLALWSVLTVAVVVLWLRNAHRVREASRTCRNLALLPLAIVLGNMLVAGVASPTTAGTWSAGVVRFAAVAIFAYGILEHQLLGLDVKVKWTIRQSTVAAVFIAVFFVFSEGAAALFEAQTGSTVAGILAAGGLVFAIAPLQRLAERVADKAMPGVKAVGEMTADERRRAYEDAASTAWSDGAIDVNERALLDRFRESLGLNEDEAHRIESEAAGEVT